MMLKDKPKHLQAALRPSGATSLPGGKALVRQLDQMIQIDVSALAASQLAIQDYPPNPPISRHLTDNARGVRLGMRVAPSDLRRGAMIKWVTAALGLVVSMAVGAGLAAAHDKAEKPSVTSETIDSLRGPDVGSQAEGDDAELKGTLEIQHEDWEDGSSVDRHFLLTHDGKRLSLEGVQHPDLLTGDLVRVRGVRSGQKLLLQTKTAESIEVVQPVTGSSTFGQQKIAVFLARFSNGASATSTAAQWKHYMETEIEPFFRENSYGQTWFVSDVFGWYTMPFTNSVGCPDSAVKRYVDLAATAAGINLSGYSRLVYFFPQTLGCRYAGLYTGNIFLNGQTGGILTHELGHSFGLTHAPSFLCPPGIILDPICGAREKGDSTDSLGSGGSGVNYRVTGHFNPLRKQALGWLDYTKVTTNGAYTIDVYEAQGTSAPKALMIPITKGPYAGWSFSVAKHPSTPVYVLQGTSIVSAGDCSGVFVHVGTAGRSSFLLDMTPETPQPINTDSCLDVGKTFTDPHSGITIGLVSMSSTSATIMVDLGGTGPSCTRSAPGVTGSPAQSPAVPAKTLVTYNVSVTNNDGAGCSASTFALQATAPTTNWQKTYATASGNINPGATLSTTLRITSPAVPNGSYTIVSAATRTTASPLSGSATVNYNVDSGGGSQPPWTFTDNFDRPDSPVLGNGWSVPTGSLMIQSEEARNETNNTFSLAVQLGLMGPTQTVEARFASTNSNSAPRFGVVVRYGGLQNYYICYRQLGGSSVVRIAKMQNGVETVLKSVGIANPALNALSTLSCQASGSTLTLRVDGVTKLSMTDGTFSTGSAGYAISTQKAGSHRADNFNALVQ
jgi:hypothetical protein